MKRLLEDDEHVQVLLGVSISPTQTFYACWRIASSLKHCSESSVFVSSIGKLTHQLDSTSAHASWRYRFPFIVSLPLTLPISGCLDSIRSRRTL